jgi:Ca2+/Na+ antiporter
MAFQFVAEAVMAATHNDTTLVPELPPSDPSQTFLQKIFVDVEALPNDGYGFCQLAFLGLAYAWILMNGANLIKDGSEMLLLIPQWAGLVGSIVLPVLGAVPDGAIVLFSGLGPDAQQQLSVGIGALAGSTIMLLTVPWFLALIAGRVNMDESGNGNYVRPRGAGSEWSKLSPPGRFRDTGVNVGPTIRHAAIVMAVTLVPFFVIQIPAAIANCSLEDDTSDCTTPKVAAIIAGVMTVLLFIFYLVDQKRQADKENDVVAESKREKQMHRAIDSRFMSLSAVFADSDLKAQSAEFYDSHGTPLTNMENPKLRKFLRPYFRRFDRDNSGEIDKTELKLLLESLGQKPTQQDVDTMMDQLDSDHSGAISFDEFVIAMQRVLSNSHQGGLNPYTNILASPGPHAPPSTLSGSAQVNAEGTCTSRTDVGAQDLADGEDDEEEEDEEMPEDLAHLSPSEQRKRILQRAFLLMGCGTVLVVFFSDPMVDVLAKLGDMTKIPPFYVSFVLAPLVSNGSELIAAFAYSGKKTEKTMTIALATLVGSAAMNNTFCLAIFLFLVAGKDLKWVFTAEVMSIVIVEVIMLFIIFLSGRSIRTWTPGVVF